MTTASIAGSGVTITTTAYTIPAAAICTGSWDRSMLTQDDLQKYDIPLDLFVIHDAPATRLPAAAANDDLAILGVTFGTDAVQLRTSDQKANGGAAAQYGRTTLRLPPEYVAGQTIQVVLAAGMVTTIADTSCTVDLEVHKVNATDGTVGADLCQTAAQDCKNLTAAAKTFTIDGSSLSPGDKLELRVALTINDAATGTAVIGRITNAYALLDIKG